MFFEKVKLTKKVKVIYLSLLLIFLFLGFVLIKNRKKSEEVSVKSFIPTSPTVIVNKGLPEYFPIDFPLYNGVDVNDVVVTDLNGQSGLSFNQKVNSNLSQALSYYEQIFKRNGWNYDKNNQGSSVIFSVKKHESECKVKCDVSGFVGILESSKDNVFVSVTLGFK